MTHKRKKLSITQKEVLIGSDLKTCDISRCCRAEIRQSRVYPRPLYCRRCGQHIERGDQIIFHKRVADVRATGVKP